MRLVTLTPMHYHELEASVYDKVYAGVTADVPFWTRLAGEVCGAEGTALELACGTLRVLLPVAEAGTRVWGIDESPHMLDLANKKLAGVPASVSERITLRQGDMRSFELQERFDLIYIPFNTFGLLLTVEDQLAALATIKKHLAPGGLFAFSVFFPDVERMRGPELSRWMLDADYTFEDGSRVQRDNVRAVNTRTQVVSNTWRTREYQDQILVRDWITDLQLSYFWPREIKHLLARAGYEIVHYWGDYQRTDFDKLNEPWQQLVVARASA